MSVSGRFLELFLPRVDGELASFLYQADGSEFQPLTSLWEEVKVKQGSSSAFCGGGYGSAISGNRSGSAGDRYARFPPLTFYRAAFSRHSLFADCGKRFRGNPHTSI